MHIHTHYRSLECKTDECSFHVSVRPDQGGKKQDGAHIWPLWARRWVQIGFKVTYRNQAGLSDPVTIAAFYKRTAKSSLPKNKISEHLF